MNIALAPGDAIISTVCLSGTLEEKLRAAAEVGFTAVELLEYDLLMSSWSPTQVAEAAASLGLSIEVYQPFHVEPLPADAFSARLRGARRKFDLLAELGAKVLVCCSARTEQGVDDDEIAREQLAAYADEAHARGLRLAIEAVPWGRVRAHDEAWRLVQRIDHPALGLCLDSFHVLSLENDADAIAGIPAAKVFHAQIADAPRRNIDVREWSLHHRMFPGQGALDVAGFLRRLGSNGYDGPIALEVFNDVYQQEDPRHAATDAMRSMRVLAEAVAAAAPDRDPVAVDADLPPAPSLRGFAFAELAVDEVSGPLLARVLRSLGFVHTGQHVTDPVQLWQQGDARVLLNRAPERSVAPATASVCAIAVESSDPAASMRRAESLLAPQLPRTRGLRESDRASVATPGGTALHFCDARRASRGLRDFVPTGAAVPASPSMRTIDHVSIAETIDDFDQAALFYRTVLGLVPTQSHEITAPFGLVRTWSAGDRERCVRVALTTAPLRQGDWSPAVSSPQCIAFTTDDALGCAQRLREGGAPILEVPGNYYDDLETRLDLPPAVLARLRANSVLYDRDDSGEFFHFFTEIIGARVFFEVVQRVGAYDGYGDRHAVPLRMAAHRRQQMRMLAGPPADETAENRHDYSLAHLTALSLTPPELVDAAAAAGYRYVGLRMTKVTAQEPHYPLANDPALMRATKTHLAATGVEVLDIELARITSGDDPRDYMRFLEAGAELGARHVIAQMPDSDFARKADRYAELCRLAAPLGLTVDLEFPSWTETPDLAEALRVLRESDQANAGLLIDLLHFTRSGSSIEELRAVPREWLHYAHVCDAPAEIPTTTAGLIHTARFERLFPGEGGLDMHAILAAMPEGIPFALEIPRAMLVAQVGPKEHARLAIQAARRHLDVRAAPA